MSACYSLRQGRGRRHSRGVVGDAGAGGANGRVSAGRSASRGGSARRSATGGGRGGSRAREGDGLVVGPDRGARHAAASTDQTGRRGGGHGGHAVGGEAGASRRGSGPANGGVGAGGALDRGRSGATNGGVGAGRGLHSSSGNGGDEGGRDNVAARGHHGAASRAVGDGWSTRSDRRVLGAVDGALGKSVDGRRGTICRLAKPCFVCVAPVPLRNSRSGASRAVGHGGSARGDGDHLGAVDSGLLGRGGSESGHGRGDKASNNHRGTHIGGLDLDTRVGRKRGVGTEVKFEERIACTNEWTTEVK